MNTHATHITQHTYTYKTHNTAHRQSMLGRSTPSGGGVSQLQFPPSLLPPSTLSCDSLLHRISDIFQPPDAPLEAADPPSVTVGAIVRLVRDDGNDATLLRCCCAVGFSCWGIIVWM